MIQNYFLWNSYKLGLKQTKELKSIQNEKLLWHGSTNCDPQKIYQGEEGFDMKYGQPGMWGKGLYFAEKSSYSNHFSYKYPNGERGLFFAIVNLGEEDQIDY